MSETSSSVASLSARLAERPARDHPLVLAFLAAATGVSLDYSFVLSPGVWVFALGAVLASWLYAWLRKRLELAALLLLLAIVALGGLWHHDRWFLFGRCDLARWARDVPTGVCLQVIARDAPRRRPPAVPNPLSLACRGEVTRLPVRVCWIRQAGRWRPASGSLVVIVQGALFPVGRGDSLRVVGFLSRIGQSANPGEPDYRNMARGRRELCMVVCRDPRGVTRLHLAQWPSLLRQAGLIRCWAERVLRQYVPPGQSPLAQALVVGSRQELDVATKDAFLTSGCLHVLAISGLHIGVLASGFWLMLRLAGRPSPSVLWVAALLTVAYAMVTGMRSPVLRASVLVIVYCLARGTGHRAISWNSLAAAALVTIGFAPSAVRDVGAQLSFLAVATIVQALPWIRRIRVVDPLGLVVLQSRSWVIRGLHRLGTGMLQGLFLSGVVWLVAWPLVATRFHIVAPAGIVLNVLLWVPIAIALFSGVLVLALAAVLPIGASLAGWVCGLALHVVQMLVGVAQACPGGHYWTPGLPSWWVGGFYVLLAGLQVPFLLSIRRRQMVVLWGWLTLGLLLGQPCQFAWRHVRPGPLRITFIAVGHGTSVLIESSDGCAMLYDTGGMVGDRRAARAIGGVLWSRGVSHLDGVVLSHADMDHCNALPILLGRFSVGCVYVSPVMFQDQTPAIRVLRAAIRQSKTPLAVLWEGDRLHLGACTRIDVLHPPRSVRMTTDNASSIVLLLRYEGWRMLLPGDLERGGLNELLGELSMHCDVVMAPHHGSPNSEPARMVQWATPDWVVISDTAGDRLRGGWSDSEVSGAVVLHTSAVGAIRISVDSSHMEVQTWRCGSEHSRNYRATLLPR